MNTATDVLFQAIDDSNLEGFNQALKDGANINAFTKDGFTPLMQIITEYAVTSTDKEQSVFQQMLKLLLQKTSINVNSQSRNYVYKDDINTRPIAKRLNREIEREI